MWVTFVRIFFRRYNVNGSVCLRGGRLRRYVPVTVRGALLRGDQPMGDARADEPTAQCARRCCRKQQTIRCRWVSNILVTDPGFAQTGGNPKGGEPSLLFWAIFSGKCMKLEKKIGWGHASLAPPPLNLPVGTEIIFLVGIPIYFCKCRKGSLLQHPHSPHSALLVCKYIAVRDNSQTY